MIIPNSYEEFPEGTYGYVYQTTHIPTGKKYVGKNQKESDWKTYYGSHQFIKEEVKKGNQADFKREILQPAFSKKELTYLENKYLFSLEVLESDEYLNDNIEGRYFKKDFDI